jgi:hypothetical protein
MLVSSLKGYKVENGFMNNSLFFFYQFDLFQIMSEHFLHTTLLRKACLWNPSQITQQRKWESGSDMIESQKLHQF